MKTAIDSSVLLDVFGGDARFGAASRQALRAASEDGALVACDVVWAEVRAHFDDDAAFEHSHRLPTMVTSKLRFDDALLAYGAKVSDSPRRAAEYVDRILKGAHPSMLPVEQPTTIGVTIPPAVLLRATQVIE